MAGTTICRRGFGYPEPLAFQHAIRFEGFGGEGNFAALKGFITFKVTGKATDVFLLMGRDGMTGNESRVMALAAGLLLVRFNPGLTNNLAVCVQQLKSRMQRIRRRHGRTNGGGPENHNYG